MHLVSQHSLDFDFSHAQDDKSPFVTVMQWAGAKKMTFGEIPPSVAFRLQITWHLPDVILFDQIVHFRPQVLSTN